MFGIGGATTGHVWTDFEFVENHARLDIKALHRVGALIAGAETEWAWGNGLKTSLRATHGQLFLGDDYAQTIRVDWLPILEGRYCRRHFCCPGCQRGCYHLHDKAGVFACRDCCRYDYKSRHRQRFSPAFRCIAMLRKKLGADPRPLSPLPPPPRQRMSRMRYCRLAAALTRAEAMAYGDLGRLLADLEERAKTQSHD
jgi:hypothetical protein